MQKVFEIELAGRQVFVDTGRYAQQAGGSCLIRCGDTAVLVCATTSSKRREGIDFFPLVVDYEEKLYSVGKIPGGFIKRESRPSEKAILTARLIDRPIRPLFPKGYFYDVQVIATTLSVDVDIPPDVLAMIGASIALSISDIPFEGPTGSVSVGMVDGEFVVNPTLEQRDYSALHLFISGTKDAVMMVEASAKEVDEQTMLEAILFGFEEIKRIVAFIEGIVNEIGKPKRGAEPVAKNEEFERRVREYALEKVLYSIDTFDREEREERSTQVLADVTAHFSEEYEDGEEIIAGVLYDMTKEAVRTRIIDEGVRPDGRALTDIRTIWSEVGVLNRTHGSSVFTRGQTQVMCVATLGAMGEVQKLDGLDEDISKRYMHQYNFPPYSVGETRMLRGPSRRDIGHGALAERALLPVVPSEEEFPYAIRLVSEVISSNGSTSQASVCASTLALMDAGVPIKAPVAGIAMGLIKDPGTGKLSILSDIQGMEDFFGDMDFKVAGTAKGITAIQMDIKIHGIDRPVFEQALERAKEGRMFILGKMLETLDKPREELSPYAPKIIQFTINPEKIREVIGPGGKMINKIIADTGVKIDIEDDGRVYIASPDSEAAEQAKKTIETIVKDIEVGEIYTGKVVRIMPFGAFVELLPGKDGLVHISKLANERVEKVEDVVKIGDEVKVKVVEIDKQGRVNLTRKGLLPKNEDKGS